MTWTRLRRTLNVPEPNHEPGTDLVRKERLLFILQFAVGTAAITVWPLVSFFTRDSLRVSVGALVIVFGCGILLSDARLRILQDQLRQSRERVELLSNNLATHTDLIRSDCEQLGFAEGFRRVAEQQPFDEVMIFAVSSQEIQSQIMASKITGSRCRLLLRGYDSYLPAMNEFHAVLDSVVRTWKTMEASGLVESVGFRRFDFHPTMYVCIFDASCLLVGLYVPVPGNYAGLAWADPVLYTNATKRGEDVISMYRNWFNDMYSSAEHGFGPNYLFSNELSESG